MNTRRTLVAAAAGSMASAALLAGSLATGTATASTVSTEAEASPQARPAFKVPFRCGQTWRADTRDGHSPSRYAIDFNRGGGNDDLGLPAVASAAGTVTKVRRLTTSYGHYVEISHGGGWSTLYAHLQEGSINVSEGQRVTATTLVGKVGSSGGDFTSHLHYEQKLNGAVQPAVMGGRAATYPATPGPSFTRPC
ncbi:hypothetical protein ASF37_04115 [Aeromicrobium sp. Leaf289]|uniref:M23 family metallopeptidase n=1 Tax=Aeromicrobium sp. Leaf289 TaxID=1736324 RepID=UPI0006FDA318|nr:M23 family metallopeptidase [Aeromicrobium sp. Leaf289]KQP77831.1 hypothetical protein ASF37_04115 [Aeromicrobium sp. Leaf289]